MTNLKNYMICKLNESDESDESDKFTSLDFDFYLNILDLIKIKEYNIDEKQFKLIYKCSELKAREIIEFFQSDDIYIIKPETIKDSFDQKEWDKYKKEIPNISNMNILTQQELQYFKKQSNKQSVINDLFGTSSEKDEKDESNKTNEFIYKLANNICQILNIGYDSIKKFKINIIKDDIYIILTTKELDINLNKIK